MRHVDQDKDSEDSQDSEDEKSDNVFSKFAYKDFELDNEEYSE
jgi:hypothetical protein